MTWLSFLVSCAILFSPGGGHVPKETFINLSDEKKEKIFRAAVDEFAAHRFSEASINQIIKSAEISRGSFYQYFNDKEDLYLYVITEIGKEKLAVIERVGQPDLDADFFQAYMYIFEVALQWAKERPLYNQIGMLMEVDNSEFIIKLRALSAKAFEMLKGMVERDKQRGLIRQHLDSDLIVDVFYTLQMQMLKEYVREGNYDGMKQKVADILELLKHGIKVS